MKKKAILFALFIILLVTAVSIFPFVSPRRTIIRNLSGTKLSNVQLVVEEYSGSKSLERTEPILSPGEWLVLQHDLSDSRVRLSYTLGQASENHVENYVDLWSGETLFIDVLPGGRVTSGYESETNN